MSMTTPEAVCEALTGPQLASVIGALHFVLADEYDPTAHPHNEKVMQRALEKLERLQGRTVSAALDSRADAAGEPMGALLICDQTGGCMHTSWPVPDYQRLAADHLYGDRGGYRTVPLYAATSTPAVDVDDSDSPAARLDMVRVALTGIVENPSNAVPLARAGLDFCNLSQADREVMRGDAPVDALPAGKVER